MSHLTTTIRGNSLNLLNPKYFDKYDEYKELLEGKVFLYSEIHPKKDEIIKIKGEIYTVLTTDVFNIEIVGNLANPKRSLRQILSSHYKCHEFLSSDYDGCLFIYSGFKSSQEEFKISESAVQLKFMVYKLKKQDELKINLV